MSLSNLDTLKQDFSGEVILPGDDHYDEASKTFVHKGQPAIIVRPADTADIASVLAFATQNRLEISIRSGGHSGQGFSTNDDGMVIDLCLINKVELIDKDKHIVRLGSGAEWGEVAVALKQYGLALSSGDTRTVGVGGLSVGGGIGWIVRKYGLAIDSLMAAEVVTADGRVLRASATENPELFWAIRGAGSNFGVITYFEFVAHPVEKVYAGTIQYGLDDLPRVLKGWRDSMRTADENLTTMLVIMPSFMGNPPAAMIMCCFADDDEAAAEAALQPFKELGKIVRQDVIRKDYAEVLEEAHPPQGVKIIVHDGFVDDFSDELIQTIAAQYSNEGGPVLQIRSLGGVMNRVPANETAFAHRSSEALIVCPSFIPPNAPDQAVKGALKPWEAIAAFTSGMYGNLLGNTEVNIQAIYPDATYRRLVQIKKTYDPENIFHNNFNIKP